MTGLDPTKDVIVEIATLLTDDDLTVVAEGPDLVLHASDAQLAAMVPVVTEMHAASGLTDAIRASTLTLEDANRETLAFLSAHVPKGEIPLCGQLDRDRSALPAGVPPRGGGLVPLPQRRRLDAEGAGPSLASRAPDLRAEKVSTHRAMEDVKASVDELRHYRAALFPVEPGGTS